jgi:hypothetical protein
LMERVAFLNLLAVVAEVGDKEPTTLVVWLVSIGLALASLALARWRWWAALLVLPVVIFYALLVLAEATDPFVGPAIRSELGTEYFAKVLVAIGTGAALPIVAAVHARRRAAQEMRAR